MSSPKRRIETDVMKMLMSDYEVTLVNDNMQEFYVRFKGPEESMQDFVHSTCRSALLKPIQRHFKEAYGGFMSNYPTNILTKAPASALSTASSIQILTSCRPPLL